MKFSKGWIKIAIVLMLSGLLLTGFTACAAEGDFKKMFQGKGETKTHQFSESFESIIIEAEEAGIVSVMLSEDGVCHVSCDETARITYGVEIRDGVLVITENDQRRWYERIFSFGNSRMIEVCLPEAEYEALNVIADTGDVTVGNLSVKNVNLKASTGDVTLSDSTVAGDVSLEVSTGKIWAENISCEGDLQTVSSTGRTDFLNVACRSLTAYGNTGDMSAYALKIAEACSITRSTGDVILENGEYGSLSVVTDTGDIIVTDAVCGGEMYTEVSTGDNKLTNVTCGSFKTTGSTGGLKMTNFIASERFSILRDTGNVTFDRCDAAEISVTVDTGSVTGTLLTDKIFMAESDTGRIDVPKTTSGGVCEITTDTGNIRISIAD